MEEAVDGMREDNGLNSEEVLAALDSMDKSRLLSLLSRLAPRHHWLLAVAAFPVALTSDLLYKLWVNFRPKEGPSGGRTPLSCVGRILLSPVCREVSRDLYEIYPAIRASLLEHIRRQPSWGVSKLEELARFLAGYVDQCRSNIPSAALAEVQRWTADAYLRPERAAESLLKAVSQGVQKGWTASRIQYYITLGKHLGLDLPREDAQGASPLLTALQLAEGVQLYYDGDIPRSLEKFGSLRGLLAAPGEATEHSFQTHIPKLVWDELELERPVAKAPAPYDEILVSFQLPVNAAGLRVVIRNEAGDIMVTTRVPADEWRSALPAASAPIGSTCLVEIEELGIRRRFRIEGTAGKLSVDLCWDPEIRYLMVAGTGFEQLSDKERMICRAVARMAVDAGFGIITGGYWGVDMIIAQDYEGFFFEKLREESNGLVSRQGESERNMHSKALLIEVARNEDWYSLSLKHSVAVIVIGGKQGGPYHLQKQGFDTGVPFFPIPATGGDAQKMFREMSQSATAPFNQVLKNPLDTAEQAGILADGIRALCDCVGSENEENAVELFVFYDMKQQEVYKELQRRLYSLRRIGLIRTWFANIHYNSLEQIDHFDTGAHRTRIMLFLLSKRYLQDAEKERLDSGWVRSERDKTKIFVVPVLVENCNWERMGLFNTPRLPRTGTPIDEYGKQEEAYTDVMRGISDILESREQPIEEITDIPANRILIVDKLTLDPPDYPVFFENVSDIGQVFDKYAPVLPISLERGGVKLSETVRLHSVRDFDADKIADESPLLQNIDRKIKFWNYVLEDISRNFHSEAIVPGRPEIMDKLAEMAYLMAGETLQWPEKPLLLVVGPSDEVFTVKKTIAREVEVMSVGTQLTKLQDILLRYGKRVVFCHFMGNDAKLLIDQYASAAATPGMSFWKMLVSYAPNLQLVSFYGIRAADLFSSGFRQVNGAGGVSFLFSKVNSRGVVDLITEFYVLVMQGFSMEEAFYLANASYAVTESERRVVPMELFKSKPASVPGISETPAPAWRLPWYTRSLAQNLLALITDFPEGMLKAFQEDTGFSLEAHEKGELAETIVIWMQVAEGKADKASLLAAYRERITGYEQRKKDAVKAVAQLAEQLAPVYRGLDLFSKSVRRLRSNSVSLVNAHPGQLSDAESVFVEFIREDLRTSGDYRIQNMYSLLVVQPANMEDPAVFARWARIAHESKVILVTEIQNLMTSLRVGTVIRDEIENSNVVVTYSLSDNGRAYPARLLLATAMFNAPIHRNSVSASGGRLSKETYQSWDMSRVLVTMTQGVVTVRPETTAYRGKVIALRNYRIVRLLDYISKLVVHMVDGFLEGGEEDDKFLVAEVGDFLRRISGKDHISSNCELLRYSFDQAPSGRIMLELLVSFHGAWEGVTIRLERAAAAGQPWETSYLSVR